MNNIINKLQISFKKISKGDPLKIKIKTPEISPTIIVKHVEVKTLKRQRISRYLDKYTVNII